MKPDSTKITPLKVPAMWDSIFADPPPPKDAYTAQELFDKYNHGEQLKAFKATLHNKVNAGQIELFRGTKNRHTVFYYRIKAKKGSSRNGLS